MKKVLFICKKRVDGYGQSVGLINSARFVVEYLNTSGVEADVVSVTDGNDIDRVVTACNPSHVIIEAIWVTPAKMKELLAIPRHSKRQWIVRIHSKIPFLANEGTALEWIIQYQRQVNHPNFRVAPNTPELKRDLVDALAVDAIYLPNVYVPQLYPQVNIDKNRADGVLDVGCFGAIRPLKNTLIQAVAAIRFANRKGQHLRFHVNGDRLEQHGNQVLKNLDALFAATSHELIRHPWMPHDHFMGVVRTMDLGLQVSLSESFNIVVADFVSAGVPIVVSPDIDWMPSCLTANPNSTDSIVAAMGRAWGVSRAMIRTINKGYLAWHNRNARREWMGFLSGGKAA